MFSCFNYPITKLSQVNINDDKRKSLIRSVVLDPIDSLSDNLQKCQISDVENLECKLDEIIDRLLSIRSELIARQFENDLPCRVQ